MCARAVSKFQAAVESLEPRWLLSAVTAYVPPTVARTSISLDSAWRFHKGDVAGAQAVGFNDSSWSSISVPHTWNALDGQDGGNNYYRGVGWYRRHLALPTSDAGRELFLQFDGADITADIFVDGTEIGSHAGGYTAFAFDVTSDVHVGADNVIAVKVSNARNLPVAPVSADYTFDGGIYRDVHLLVLNKLHVDPLNAGSPGVFLQTTDVSAASATLQATVDVRNDLATKQNFTVRTVVVDASGNVVKTLTTAGSLAAHSGAAFSSTAIIAHPHLWDGRNDPYLYSAYAQVTSSTGTTDVVQQPLGFRWFQITVNDGFFLNGQPYDLHGVDFHQDRLNEGWAITPADTQQDVSLIDEIGATAVRLSHYPHSQLTYNLLDRDGILAWSEIPLVNTISSAPGFADNALQQLREMILQNFNHPSVFVWGLFNEISGSGALDPNPLIAQLNALAHQLDPTRLTTAASNATTRDPVNHHTDVIAFNRYYGWYYGTLADVPAALDALHAGLPNTPVGLSEYGAGASIFQHTVNPTGIVAASSFHPEEYQDLFHEAYWAAISTRKYLWCKFVWNMFDFASDNRAEGDTSGRNDKGLITFDRKTKKDAFYFYKANWSSSPVLYIADRRFTQRTSPTTNVKIYSNCDSVTLKVNGVVIGTLKPSAIHVFNWTGVHLATGVNTIQVTGTRGGKTYTDSCTWTLG